MKTRRTVIVVVMLALWVLLMAIKFLPDPEGSDQTEWIELLNKEQTKERLSPIHGNYQAHEIKFLNSQINGLHNQENSLKEFLKMVQVMIVKVENLPDSPEKKLILSEYKGVEIKVRLSIKNTHELLKDLKKRLNKAKNDS